MNRIERIFAEARTDGRKLLMPFVCGGRPSTEALPDLLAGLEQSGASIVEIGFPFSDPIADGPVIAAAMHEALRAGVAPRSLLAKIRDSRDSVGVGLVAMVSMSIVGRIGLVRFVAEARDAGVDGLIVPDAPVEESEDLASAARDAGMTLSLLVAPTTSGDRLERVVGSCTGFVYLMARLGITGESSGEPDVARRVEEVRALTDVPIACGFGISTPEQVSNVTRSADAAIVGSALVRRMEDAIEQGCDAVKAATEFTTELAGGLTITS